MYGITFKDTHSSEFGVIIHTNANPMLPKLRVSEISIPSKSSTYKFTDGYEDRTIRLVFKIIDKNFIEKRNRIRSIAQWLTGKGKLIFDYEPEKYYKAEVFSGITPTIDPTVDTFEVTFLCEPFALAEYENVVAKDNITTTDTLTAINNGTYESNPMIEITGTAESITIASSGGSFAISTIDAKTIIDCENMLCYTVDGLGQKANKLIDFTGAFIKLEPGMTNVDISGVNLNVSVTIKNRDTYL